MNFGKHFNNVKNFIGQGYHHGKRFLGHLDHAYRTGKDIPNDRTIFTSNGT